MITNIDNGAPEDLDQSMIVRYTPPWLYNISPTALKVYMVLGSLTSAGRPEVTVSRKALANLVGYKSPRNLDRYLAELASNNIITVVPNRREDGGTDASTYRVGDIKP